MAAIIDIRYFQDERITRTERAKEKLREIFEPMGTWESPEEKARFYMDLAEHDRKACIC